MFVVVVVIIVVVAVVVDVVVVVIIVTVVVVVLVVVVSSVCRHYRVRGVFWVPNGSSTCVRVVSNLHQSAVSTEIEMCSGCRMKVRDVFEFDRVCIMEKCRYYRNRDVSWVPNEGSGCFRI